jgi:hypothetical protein
MSGGGVFYAVFLLRAGIAAHFVFGAIAFMVMCRFILRPWILVLGKRFGLKPLVIFGTVAVAVQYPLLAEVHAVDHTLLVLCIVSAIGDTFYWTCYHAYYASLGDPDLRGSQLGAREALAAIVGIAGPLLGGWALMSFGARIAFGATAIVQLFAALPLLATPNVRIASEAPGALRAAFSGMIVFVSDGWIAAGYVFVWQIALFLSLGESFSAFGGAMALAAFAGAIGGLLLGRVIDAGHGRHAVALSLTVLAASAFFRSASTGAAALAVIANATGAFVGCLYVPSVMTMVYNQAKRSPCPLRFHIATEGAWDIGCAGGCLSAAFLSFYGVPLSLGILSSVFSILPLYLAVRRHYGAEVFEQAEFGIN